MLLLDVWKLLINNLTWYQSYKHIHVLNRKQYFLTNKKEFIKSRHCSQSKICTLTIRWIYLISRQNMWMQLKTQSFIYFCLFTAISWRLTLPYVIWWYFNEVKFTLTDRKFMTASVVKTRNGFTLSILKRLTFFILVVPDVIYRKASIDSALH